MSKHTEGPWKFEHDESRDHEGLLQNFALLSNGVSFLYSCSCCEGVHVSEHDAHLISQAPNLLADLELAAETLRRYEGYHRAKGTQESLNKADANQALAIRFEATIARARGETS